MGYFDKDFLRVHMGRVCIGYLIENFFLRFSKSLYRKSSYGISDRKFFFDRFPKIRIGYF